MRIEGGCHCGNVRYTLDWPDDASRIAARACGCGFCVKHGGVWTSSREARLEATIADRALLSTYAFGTRTARFHVCARCGVPPFVTSEIDGALYAVVNVNTFENVDRSTVDRSPADFEGEDIESRLARRQRNWIPAVRVSTRAP